MELLDDANKKETDLPQANVKQPGPLALLLLKLKQEKKEKAEKEERDRLMALSPRSRATPRVNSGVSPDLMERRSNLLKKKIMSSMEKEEAQNPSPSRKVTRF